jgi:hypothetical protein
LLTGEQTAMRQTYCGDRNPGCGAGGRRLWQEEAPWRAPAGAPDEHQPPAARPPAPPSRCQTHDPIPPGRDHRRSVDGDLDPSTEFAVQAVFFPLTLRGGRRASRPARHQRRHLKVSDLGHHDRRPLRRARHGGIQLALRQRALAAKTYLVSLGVPADRLGRSASKGISIRAGPRRRLVEEPPRPLRGHQQVERSCHKVLPFCPAALFVGVGSRGRRDQQGTPQLMAEIRMGAAAATWAC